MRTSIALVSAALLLGAASWRSADTTSRPLRGPRGLASSPLPCPARSPLPGFLETLLRAHWPAAFHATPELAPEPETGSERRMDLAHMKIVKREIARLLEQAYVGVYQGRYDLTIVSCDGILRFDPHYGVALELRALARRLRHMNVADPDSVLRAIDAWVAATRDDIENPAIPHPEILRFPTRDEWAELLSSGDEDPELLTIHRKLDTMKIDLSFNRTKLEDVLAFIRDFSGLNILLDAAVRDQVDPDVPIDFHVKDLVLKDVLRRLLTPFSLDYQITEERVVLLTRPPGFPAFETNGSIRLDPVVEPVPYGFEAVIAATRVDLDVQNWPLSAIVDELRRKTGLDLRLLGQHDEYTSFKARELRLPALLTLLLRPRNLDYTVDGVTIWIGRDADRY